MTGTSTGTEAGTGIGAGTVEFAMPSLGADMDAGTILEWRVGPGDRVARGDLVAVVETDKADIDIEVWQSGTVTELLVEPGLEVPVGTPLALIDLDEGTGAAPGRGPESASGPSPAPGPSDRSAAAATPTPTTNAPGPVTLTAPPTAAVTNGPALPIPASPLARRLAAERGIDLATVTPSGPEGAIVARDLDAGRSRPEPRSRPAPRTEPEREPEQTSAERMRSAIAEVMARSKRDIPHYYLAQDIDLQAAMTWLAASNAERSVEDRILPSALLLKAVAVAAAANPQLNGFWIGDRFRPGDGVHLGVAVSLRGGGLVAPAIHDTDGRSLDELMAALRDLVGRARSGRLRGSEMTDSTLTVSNLGDRGVDLIAGVIYPPQVALVGLGRVSTRPAVVDGQILARPQVTATLSADHRATDGQLGARYLTTIDRLLQKPEQL